MLELVRDQGRESESARGTADRPLMSEKTISTATAPDLDVAEVRAGSLSHKRIPTKTISTQAPARFA